MAIEVIEVLVEGLQGPEGPTATPDSRLDAMLVAINTKAAFGNTVVSQGKIIVNLIGTGDSDLPPPTDGQPTTGGNYNGYIPVPFNEILSAGEVSVVGSEIVVGAGGAGDYNTPHAWIDTSADTNAAVIGYIFAIHKASNGLLYFSDRVVSQRAAAQGLVTNIAGGGFVSGLEEGDTLSTWVASSLSTELTIYDANVGIQMVLPESLRQLT